jgi:hypothetical protein
MRHGATSALLADRATPAPVQRERGTEEVFGRRDVAPRVSCCSSSHEVRN